MMKETPLLETLKRDGPKSQKIFAWDPSFLGEGKGAKLIILCGLHLQLSKGLEHEDLHSLAFSLIPVFKHSGLTFSRAGHTGIACLLGCSSSSMYCSLPGFYTPLGGLCTLVLEAFLHDSAFATARASRVSQWCQVSWLGTPHLRLQKFGSYIVQS